MWYSEIDVSRGRSLKKAKGEKENVLPQKAKSYDHIDSVWYKFQVFVDTLLRIKDQALAHGSKGQTAQPSNKMAWKFQKAHLVNKELSCPNIYKEFCLIIKLHAFRNKGDNFIGTKVVFFACFCLASFCQSFGKLKIEDL